MNTSCSIIARAFSRTGYVPVGWNRSSSGLVSDWNIGEAKSFSTDETWYAITRVLENGEFIYTGNIQTITLTEGTYKFEVWGAQGGTRETSCLGGQGGYAIGTYTIDSEETLYIAVGGRGERTSSIGSIRIGGFNGGGNALAKDASYIGSGGGATHIAKAPGTLESLSENRNSVLIVAGGGGGSGDGGDTGDSGGAGGGLSGIRGNNNGQSPRNNSQGTQTTGGAAHNTTWGTPGVFGQGGSYNDLLTQQPNKFANVDISGGGGGWFGGGSSSSSGAGGGSGYIGGVTSGYGIEAITIAGNESMPSPSGGTIIGHGGHGFARITKIS